MELPTLRLYSIVVAEKDGYKMETDESVEDGNKAMEGVGR